MPTSPATIAARLKLRHLRFIVALAETGSMAGTAQRLSVSYPAVVKTRLEIEAAAGARLLTGRGDASSLTEIGRCLAQASRRILAELDCASEEIAALRDGLHGHVVVGVRSLDALRWLAPEVVEFRRQYPGVTLALVDGLHHDIAGGTVDIGLARIGPGTGGRRHPAQAFAGQSKELTFAPLFSIRSVVIGSGACAGLRSARPDWAALLQRPWCLPPPGTPLRDRMDAFIASMGLAAPADVVEISDMTAQVEMLRAGGFLAVASQEVAQELLSRGIGQVVADDLPALDDHIALIWRTQPRLHPAVAQLRDFLLARGTKLSGAGHSRSHRMP